MRLEGDRPRAVPARPSRHSRGPRRLPPSWRALLAVACAIALAAAIIGLLVGRGGPEHELARRFAGAWERGDYAAMYRELSPQAARRVGPASFATAYRSAMQTATATRVDAGRPRRHGHEVVLPVSVTTRIFGEVRGTVRLPIAGSGDDARIAWAPRLVFPGLRSGVRLTRRTRMPPRAAILARDGTPLAKGPARTSPIPDVAAEVVGRLGPIPPERHAALVALGYPDDARVGATGLERILEPRLAGRPGGVLLAGSRVLGRGLPRAASSVRTSVWPKLEREAAAALGGRLGGVVALRPRTGEILAFSGIAFSGLQPPGSTFKLVTLTGVLEAGLATPDTAFPYATYATLSGVRLANANGETCGGTLAQALAISCNSVFAPLGAQLGASRLVEVAQRYGFNSRPTIAGASTSTIPPAAEIGDDLAVGSTAIGQGRVLASPLQMATVAATIALRGRRPRLTVLATATPAPTTRVTTKRVAITVERLMEGVVRSGTGKAAQIPGVRVAGKTGTAELGTTHRRCVPTPAPSPSAPSTEQSCATPAADDPTDTDAWFVAYAPAGRGDPPICVGVMLVRAGAGGDTAAPVARRVLAAALG